MTRTDGADIEVRHLLDDGSWNTDDADVFRGGSEVTNKSDLVGIPIMIVGVNFNAGENNRIYATIEFYTKTSTEPSVFNDGGSGVKTQLIDYLRDKGQLGAGQEPQRIRYPVKLVCRKGLRVSEYETPDGRQAATYYLA